MFFLPRGTLWYSICRNMKSVFVTGCAGFIGSTLCEQLLKGGYRVIGIDNFDPFYSRALKAHNLKHSLASLRFKFYEGDISDKESLNSMDEPVDAVIHIAAKVGVRPSIYNPGAYISANISGTQNVLEWMNVRGVKKLVFASSSSVYGNDTPVPFSESTSVDSPISPYAFTKKGGELLNYTYHYLYQFDIVNLRFFTVYGERQRPDLAIHKFVDAISKKQPITMYGAGDTSRDYTYVQDTVAGIMGALNYVLENKNVFETANLGNSHPVSLKELVDTIYELMEEKPNIHHEPKQAGDVDITFADISKAKRLFGYEPKTNLRDGLKNFITWYNEQQIAVELSTAK